MGRAALVVMPGAEIDMACAGNLFEEVEPAVILKDRKNENGTRDFLVKWADGEEDTWVKLFRRPLSGSTIC
jgi:hypothetical protein